MTVYFAPPGEPLDGDNWQEIGEAIMTVEPHFKEMAQHRLLTRITATHEFKIEPSPQSFAVFFGYDVVRLYETTSEWLSRPVYPILPIKKVLSYSERQARFRQIAQMIFEHDMILAMEEGDA